MKNKGRAMVRLTPRARLWLDQIAEALVERGHKPKQTRIVQAALSILLERLTGAKVPPSDWAELYLEKQGEENG